MNKRIDDLVGHTADIMPGVYTLEYESGDKGVEFTEAALEKFVSLILFRCYELIDSGNSDHAGANRIAIEQIKEYFKDSE